MGARDLPGFGTSIRVPLNEKELILVGRIVTTFGQIERLTDMLLLLITREENIWSFQAIHGHRQFSSKLNLLRDLAKLQLNDEQELSVLDFYSDAARLTPARNAMVHGAWGWLHSEPITAGPNGTAVSGENVIGIAAQSFRAPEEPFMATKLEDLDHEAQALAEKACAAWASLTGNPLKLPLTVDFTSMQKPRKL